MQPIFTEEKNVVKRGIHLIIFLFMKIDCTLVEYICMEFDGKCTTR